MFIKYFIVSSLDNDTSEKGTGTRSKRSKKKVINQPSLLEGE